jgi:sporulation protein YlmC with PRC-barrel domain
MVVLAVLLTAPAILAAQTTTSPTAAPLASTMTAPGSAGMATPHPMPSAGTADNSTYITADHHIRASKIVGASVYNDQNEKIGSVDDVLIGSNDDISGVVLSVGGFLGIASKLVEVPYKDIRVQNDELMIAGATKDQLTSLPEYKYASRS